MPELPYIKFYAADFIGGTSGLSPAERGVYITLLCLMFDGDGPVLRDDARLARRCGAPKATFVRILGALIAAGKIIETDGFLSNERAERALIDRQIRARNARVAANSRWRERDGKSEGNQSSDDADATPKQCVDDARPETRDQRPEGSIGRGSNEPPPIPPTEAEARAWSADDLFDAVIHSVGLRPDKLPAYWLRASATIHVNRWRTDLGIPPHLIVQAARESRLAHPEPPSGPRALDRVMKTLAATLAAPKMEISDGHDRTTAPPANAGRGSPADELLAGFLRAADRDRG